METMSNALFPEFSSPVIMSHTLDDDDDGTGVRWHGARGLSPPSLLHHQPNKSHRSENRESSRHALAQIRISDKQNGL